MIKQANLFFTIFILAAILQACGEQQQAPTQAEAIAALPPGYEGIKNYSCEERDIYLVYRCKFDLSGQPAQKEFRKDQGRWVAIFDPS